MRNTRHEDCEDQNNRPHPDKTGCDNPFSLRAIIAAFLQIRVRQTPPK
jgi:hypothetical protein